MPKLLMLEEHEVELRVKLRITPLHENVDAKAANESVLQAVRLALQHGYANGFTHELAEDISIEVADNSVTLWTFSRETSLLHRQGYFRKRSAQMNLRTYQTRADGRVYGVLTEEWQSFAEVWDAVRVRDATTSQHPLSGMNFVPHSEEEVEAALVSLEKNAEIDVAWKLPASDVPRDNAALFNTLQCTIIEPAQYDALEAAIPTWSDADYRAVLTWADSVIRTAVRANSGSQIIVPEQPAVLTPFMNP
jgi:hypothetical protein